MTGTPLWTPRRSSSPTAPTRGPTMASLTSAMCHKVILKADAYNSDNANNVVTQAAILETLTSTTHITSGWQSTSSSRCQHQQHVNTLDHSVYISQALLFYIPRCIWLSLEGGLMKFLVMGHQGWIWLKLSLFWNILVMIIFFAFHKNFLAADSKSKSCRLLFV